MQIILRQVCHCTLVTSQPSPPCKGHRFISLIYLLHSLTTLLVFSEMLIHGVGASALESQPLRALVLSLAGQGLVLRGHFLFLFAQGFSSAEEQLCQVSEALDLGHARYSRSPRRRRSRVELFDISKLILFLLYGSYGNSPPGCGGRP